MRITLIALVLLAGMASCRNEQKPADKDHLSTDLIKNPYTADGTDTSMMGNMATMDFTDSIHNFDPISEGESVSYDFHFTNHGKSPLIVSSAEGSCGCTIGSIPKEPVLPGASDVIRVTFNSSGKMGHQEKMVTVTSNSTKGTQHLYIIGDVGTH